MIPCIGDIPVLLPGHDEGDLQGLHYHQDNRYSENINFNIVHRGPVNWRELPLIREMPENRESAFGFLLMLLLRYKGKTNCGKCIHQGLELGKERCPGHGLPTGIVGDYHIQIVEAPDHIVLLEDVRVVIPVTRDIEARSLVLMELGNTITFNDPVTAEAGDQLVFNFSTKVFRNGVHIGHI